MSTCSVPEIVVLLLKCRVMQGVMNPRNPFSSLEDEITTLLSGWKDNIVPTRHCARGMLVGHMIKQVDRWSLSHLIEDEKVVAVGGRILRHARRRRMDLCFQGHVLENEVLISGSGVIDIAIYPRGRLGSLV